MVYRHNLRRILSLSLAMGALFLAGCAGTPTARFYSLTPMALQQTATPANAGKKVTINVAPIELPDYLNRLQIVTRDGRNELKLAEFDRWAGSLAENIGIVLAENLAQHLGSEQIFVYPRVQSKSPDYTVAVRLLQLDCSLGEQVRFKAQWTVLAGTERKEILTRMSSISEKLGDKQYATLAAGVSRTLEQLSGEIAREVQALPIERK